MIPAKTDNWKQRDFRIRLMTIEQINDDPSITLNQRPSKNSTVITIFIL